MNERLVNEVKPTGHPVLDKARQEDVPHIEENTTITHPTHEDSSAEAETVEQAVETNNAAPLYNTKTDTSQRSKPAPLRSDRDKSLADILAGN